MSDNPLVAQPRDSTEWYTGIGVAEAVVDVVAAVESGNWIDIGISGVSAGLEALSTVADPLGTLFSGLIGWLLEHVEPLRKCLDWLAGNGSEVAAQAQTWRNVAESVQATADALRADVDRDTAGWTGAAADAYRQRMGMIVELTRAQAQAATALGAATESVGALVGTVRETVRDFIADCVGRLAAWALEALLTKGLGLVLVAEQAKIRVARWIARVVEIIVKLIRTLSRLLPLIGKLVDLLTRIGTMLKKLADGGGPPEKPPSRKPGEKPGDKPGDRPGEKPEPPGGDRDDNDPPDPPDEPPPDHPDPEDRFDPEARKKIEAVQDIVTNDSGELLGYEDSRHVRLISPDTLQDVREDLHDSLGEPQTKQTPRGPLEVWFVSDNPKVTITYRPYSKSGGPTIDFNDMEDEIGMDRFHVTKG